jgi:Disulphide bond corrector protein DsbC
MKPGRWLAMTALLLLSSCRMADQEGFDILLHLGSFSKSRVNVELYLVVDEDSQPWLEATFTPEGDCHLYGKDIPMEGVDGVGRPTLLEVVPGGQMAADGALRESPAAYQEDGPDGLLVYPPGEVTLRLPVRLPDGKGWFDEQVSITYMACREGTCYAPVVHETLDVSIPGVAELQAP